jgi:dTDP-4-amino-4,6-dideoxygalactose transaminase
VTLRANRRLAFEVVDLFERLVAEYTGAPHAVAVDSCTNAIFLSVLYLRQTRKATAFEIPKRTYVGVAQSIKNAGATIKWRDEDWKGMYEMKVIAPAGGASLYDAAKRFTAGMYVPGSLTCVSFAASKLLPIGQGGAILTESEDAVRWLKRARFDGRPEGDRCGQSPDFQVPGYHMYMSPPDAARGLWLMTYLPDVVDDQPNDFDDLSRYEAFK